VCARRKSRLRAFPHRIAISSQSPSTARYLDVHAAKARGSNSSQLSNAADSAQHCLQAVAWTRKRPRNAPCC
jgi:hypothetical protein